jgi:hypothetical protein
MKTIGEYLIDSRKFSSTLLLLFDLGPVLERSLTGGWRTLPGSSLGRLPGKKQKNKVRPAHTQQV